MSFENIGLEPRLLKGVKAMGYHEPTPIQLEAIPPALKGRDVVGCAQTGTGKTAAFVLPALQRLGRSRKIGVLVVTPTRELALQIKDTSAALCPFTGHKVMAVFGGVNYNSQAARLRRGH